MAKCGDTILDARVRLAPPATVAAEALGHQEAEPAPGDVEMEEAEDTREENKEE